MRWSKEMLLPPNEINHTVVNNLIPFSGSRKGHWPDWIVSLSFNSNFTLKGWGIVLVYLAWGNCKSIEVFLDYIMLVPAVVTRGHGQDVHLLMKQNRIVNDVIECSLLPQHSITSETASLSSCCIMCFCFIMPARSLCVIVQIDSLHICCQGHHQGLMNERWKETEVEQQRKGESSLPPPSPYLQTPN